MAAKAAAAAKSTSQPASKASAKKPALNKVGGKKAVPNQSKKAPVAKKPATKRAPAARKKTARKVEGNVVTPVVWGPAQRTAELAEALGGVTALARALGVSPSQPSRWKSGKESPSPEVERKLIDLDHVVARARLVWHPDVVPVWLRSSNQHLYGQSPLGVL